MYSINNIELIREAAKDPSLSDAAFRLLVLSQGLEPTNEHIQWAKQAIKRDNVRPGKFNI